MFNRFLRGDVTENRASKVTFYRCINMQSECIRQENGMTDQELRKLNRSELLQMLIDQVEENKSLQERLGKVEAQLAERQLKYEKAGSLAEAALALNGVFQAADDAARQYLENIEMASRQQEEICRGIQEKAERKALLLLKEAEEYKKKAKEEADEYWVQVQKQVETLLQNHAALRDLLHAGGGNGAE